MCLQNRINSHQILPLVKELTELGVTTVGVDPALAGYGVPHLDHQAIVREHALLVTTPFVRFPFGSLRLRLGDMGRPDNRTSQIRATGWAVYRGWVTPRAVMGRLLLARFLAGEPVTLFRGVTADAVLNWREKDMELMSEHQRQAVRCAAMETREGFGPFIVAIDIEDERSFARAQADDRFFPLEHPALVWAEEPPVRHGR